jgi:stearoyl-CoA desaturase (delta-9 desaturase)
MAFIDYVLETPSYGWKDEKGDVVKPTSRQLFHQVLHNVNIFRTRKNWISAIGPISILSLMPLFLVFVFQYFTWINVLAFIFYAMVVMGTHGTIWYHRYCTHNSYTFKNGFWRFLTQNLVVKTIPEEIYVVSHHVHHSKSDEPGDPYNARAGFGYCMLAPINHQIINRNLNEADYNRAARFMRHTGVRINSYEQYRKWGSIASPFYTIALLLVNWAFWYGVFYLVGGHGLSCAILSAGLFWLALVPAFNYTGHGKGEEKHVEGLDYDRTNLSINQWRPGYFAGEWHNNHHLYPASARCGFLSWQLDVPWLYVKLLHKIGAVTSYHDSTKDFIQKYHEKKMVKMPAAMRPLPDNVQQPAHDTQQVN